MSIDLIYANWPNQSHGLGWHKMAEAMRRAGLALKLQDEGHAVAEHVLDAEGEHPGELKAAFELARRIGTIVKASREAGRLAVILCGSCSVAAMGAVAGLGGEETGVLWIDAHADLNTPATSLSGLFDGMAAAILIGEAWQAMAFDIAGLSPIGRRSLCLYGARDLDAAERLFIDQEAIAVAENAEDAVSMLEGNGLIYIHLDMDAHDPAMLQVNRFGAAGGPSPEALRSDLAALAAALPVAALSVTAIDPEAGAGEKAFTAAIGHIVALCRAWKFARE